MDIFQMAALMLGPAGAAWVGVKVSLNGTRESVRRIERSIDELSKDVATNREEIIRLQMARKP